MYQLLILFIHFIFFYPKSLYKSTDPASQIITQWNIPIPTMLPTFAPTFCSFSAAVGPLKFLFLLNQQNLYKIHYIRKIQSQHSLRLWSLVRRKRFPTLRSCFKKRSFT